MSCEKNKKDIKEIIDEIIDRLRKDKQQRGYNGCLVMLSPGPGEDGNGAPGLCSAIALKLCIEAYNAENVIAITFDLDKATDEDFSVLKLNYNISDLSIDQLPEWVITAFEGYNRPEWIDAAGKYVQNFFGSSWEKVRITRAALRHCISLAEYGIEKVPAEIATEIRSNLLKHLTFKKGFAGAAGTNAIAANFFPNEIINDCARISPLLNLDRTTIIEIGRYFGIEERILYAPPSNGAFPIGKSEYEKKYGANRYLTKIFKECEWDKNLITILDIALHNLKNKNPIIYNLPDSITINDKLLIGLKRAEIEYNSLNNQLLFLD